MSQAPTPASARTTKAAAASRVCAQRRVTAGRTTAGSDAASARAVVDELKAAGLPEDDIGIIAQSRSIPMENADVENAGDMIDRDRDGHDDRGEMVNKSAGIGAASIRYRTPR